MSLTGPSHTIVVEPIRETAAPAPEPPRREEPAPDTEREREPTPQP